MNKRSTELNSSPISRRKLIAAIGGSATVTLSGCLGDDEEPEETSEESEDDSGEDDDGTRDSEEEEEEESQADAVLSYEVTEGSNWDEELPDPISDWMKYVVLSFEVEEGEISMEDLWFRSRIDTGERYQPADAQTDNALENGIEDRGTIIEGGTGDILYKAPTFVEQYTWNLSGLRRQTVTGENIQVDEPGEPYDDVTVSIDIEITEDSDIITPEAEEFRGENQYWGIVSIEVVEGVLNVEDVWFRSALEVGNRRESIDYASNRNIKRGMRPRGEIKQGYRGHALYLASEDTDDASWYTEDMRHTVTIE